MEIVNGVEVADGWAEQVAEAQMCGSYEIGGKAYARIRYGDESENWGAKDG